VSDFDDGTAWKVMTWKTQGR